MAAAVKFEPPKSFDFERVTGEAWEEWKARWERYQRVSGLKRKDSIDRVDALVYSLGPAAERVLKGFHLSKAEEESYDSVFKAFDRHFSPRRNIIFERTVFFSKR